MTRHLPTLEKPSSEKTLFKGKTKREIAEAPCVPSGNHFSIVASPSSWLSTISRFRLSCSRRSTKQTIRGRPRPVLFRSQPSRGNLLTRTMPRKHLSLIHTFSLLVSSFYPFPILSSSGWNPHSSRFAISPRHTLPVVPFKFQLCKLA